MSKQCYVCGQEINKENSSKEHLIPNALGGRISSNGLLCKKCNSSFGDTIDAELCKQFEVIASLLNINRDRGKPRAVELSNPDTGEIILFDNGKIKSIKPEITIDESSTGKEISVKANSPKEMLQVFKGLERTYPQLKHVDINEKIKNQKIIRRHKHDNYCYSSVYGRIEAFDAILKIVINYYMFYEFDRKHIDEAISHLVNGSGKKYVYYYYPFIEKKSGVDFDVINSVTIIGNRQENILYGYVELFNFFKCLVLLNENYNGDDICKSYHYSLIMESEIEKESLVFKLNKEKISEIKNDNENNYVDLHNMLQSELRETNYIIQIKQYIDTYFYICDKKAADLRKKYGVKDFNELSEENLDRVKKEFEEDVAMEIYKIDNKIDDELSQDHWTIVKS